MGPNRAEKQPPLVLTRAVASKCRSRLSVRRSKVQLTEIKTRFPSTQHFTRSKYRGTEITRQKCSLALAAAVCGEMRLKHCLVSAECRWEGSTDGGVQSAPRARVTLLAARATSIATWQRRAPRHGTRAEVNISRRRTAATSHCMTLPTRHHDRSHAILAPNTTLTRRATNLIRWSGYLERPLPEGGL